MLQASCGEEGEVAAEEEQVEEEGTIGTDVPPSESQTTDLGDSQATGKTMYSTLRISSN